MDGSKYFKGHLYQVWDTPTFWNPACQCASELEAICLFLLPATCGVGIDFDRGYDDHGAAHSSCRTDAGWSRPATCLESQVFDTSHAVFHWKLSKSDGKGHPGWNPSKIDLSCKSVLPEVLRMHSGVMLCTARCPAKAVSKVLFRKAHGDV